MKENLFERNRQIVKSNYHLKGKAKEFRIEIRREPLFGLYSTQICPERADRPKGFGNRANYTNKEIEKLVIEILENPEQLSELNDDDLKNEIRRRLDSYFEEDLKRTDRCPFCYPNILNVTPEPRFEHQISFAYHDPKFELASTDGRVLSVPNLKPFAPYHWVTPTARHKTSIKELSEEDMTINMQVARELSNYLKSNTDMKGKFEFGNIGIEAAASQPHAHFQRGGIPRMMITEIDHEIRVCKTKTMVDPFEFYMEEIRKSKDDRERSLFIFENEHIFISAAFAPKVPCQIDIFCKYPGANLLDVPKSEDEILASSMLGVFHALYDRCGVTDLNIITHEAGFNEHDTNYRLHWHILPRNLSKLGGIEMENSYIVPFYPEETAQLLFEHYNSSS